MAQQHGVPNIHLKNGKDNFYSRREVSGLIGRLHVMSKHGIQRRKLDNV
jgi:hypothetical protein